MTLIKYLARLRACQTQEDVDKVVTAAAATLNENDLGHFLIKVKKRRAQLPPRGVSYGG